MSERVKYEFTCKRCGKVETVDSAAHVSREDAARFLRKSCGWEGGVCDCRNWVWDGGFGYNRRTGRTVLVCVTRA